LRFERRHHRSRHFAQRLKFEHQRGLHLDLVSILDLAADQDGVDRFKADIDKIGRVADLLDRHFGALTHAVAQKFDYARGRTVTHEFASIC